MSERVRLYIGDRERPTLAFDLLDGVNLFAALNEIVQSAKRRETGEITAGPGPRTHKVPVDLRAFLSELDP